MAERGYERKMRYNNFLFLIIVLELIIISSTYVSSLNVFAFISVRPLDYTTSVAPEAIIVSDISELNFDGNMLGPSAMIIEPIQLHLPTVYSPLESDRSKASIADDPQRSIERELQSHEEVSGLAADFLVDPGKRGTIYLEWMHRDSHILLIYLKTIDLEAFKEEFQGLPSAVIFSISSVTNQLPADRAGYIRLLVNQPAESSADKVDSLSRIRNNHDNEATRV
jgi:hypothetical protein